MRDEHKRSLTCSWVSGQRELRDQGVFREFGLWFVFGRFLALFEPEFEQSGLPFRLGNVLQRERTRQAIFIERPLLRVGFLKRVHLQSFPIRIGDSRMGTQEVDLDGLERKDFRQHLDDRGIGQKSWSLISHDSSLQLGLAGC